MKRLLLRGWCWFWHDGHSVKMDSYPWCYRCGKDMVQADRRRAKRRGT